MSDITTDEQIKYLLCGANPPNDTEQAILASLTSLRDAEKAMPVEPHGFDYMRQCYADDRKIALTNFEREALEYIDALKSFATQMMAERDIAVEMHETEFRNRKQAEAEREQSRKVINSAAAVMRGEGVEDQGEAWDKCLRILDAAIDAAKEKA